jgi:hypothetical protein
MYTEIWAKLAYNVILAYAGAVDDKVWQQVSVELELAYDRDGKITHETLCLVGSLVNPDIPDDEGELGSFAWILDEAVSHFLG